MRLCLSFVGLVFGSNVLDLSDSNFQSTIDSHDTLWLNFMLLGVDIVKN